MQLFCVFDILVIAAVGLVVLSCTTFVHIEEGKRRQNLQQFPYINAQLRCGSVVLFFDSGPSSLSLFTSVCVCCTGCLREVEVTTNPTRT